MKSFMLLLVVFLLSGQAFASDEMQSVLQQQIDSVGIDQVTDALPDEAKALYDGFSNLEQADLQEGIRQILYSSLSHVGTGIRAALGSAGKLLAVALLCALVRTVTGKPEKALRLAGILSATLIGALDLNTMVGLGRTTMEETSVFAAAVLPVLSAVTAASGAPATSAALYAATVFVTQVLNHMLLQVFLPLTHICLGCACAEL